MRPQHTKTQLEAVRKELAGRNLSLRYSDEHEEYRVNFKGGREATAYYTNSLEDARITGEAMAAMVKSK